MSETIDFDRSEDGLYRGVHLAHTVELPVLGIPVRFETNSRTVLAAIEESFGPWRALRDQPALLSAERIRIRFIVHEGRETGAGHAPLTYRMPDPGHRIIMTAGSVAVAELDRREGYGYVTPELVADRAHFRYGIIEALTFMLASDLDRHPLHAAVVVRNGSALLLHGASGTGKSTLAYAAARAGLRILSEDVVYLQLEPEFRVWGIPGRLHLPGDAPSRFPEIRDRTVTLLANGKKKIPVDLMLNGTALAPTPASGTVGVCLLQKGSGSPTLKRQDAAQVEAALAGDPEMGFDVYAEAIRPRLQRLAKGGGWRLDLAENPLDAIPLIEQMLDDLDRRAEPRS